MTNIIDFTESGGVNIEISQIDADYSLMLNHWKDAIIQLEEIERDIAQPDLPERSMFLQKYAHNLKEVFEIDDDYEELQKLVSDFIDEEIRLQDPNANSSKEYTTEDWRKFFKMVDEEESEEEQNYNEERYKVNIKFIENNETDFIYNDFIEVLQIYNFKLKHSLAWYLMDRVTDEIEKIDQKIEIQKGFIKACGSSESIQETLSLIRQSDSTYFAFLKLKEHYSLSDLQANAILNEPIKELMTLNKEKIKSQINFLDFLKYFLEKLKN